MAKSYMQKQAVIAALSTRTNLPREQVALVMETYATLIAEELVAHGGINLPDLGRAKVVTRRAVAERHSVNPRTREPMVIPAVPAKDTYRAKFGKDFMSRLAAIKTPPTK